VIRLSTNLTFEVADDALEVSLVENGFLLGSAEEESGATEVIDLAGNAFGMVVDESKETIGEDGVAATWLLGPIRGCFTNSTTGDTKMVFDVGGGLFEVEGFKMVANGDTLIEGFVGGETELEGQVRLAEEDEGEQGGGIHLVVEQKAKLVEEVVREQVSLVDDEEDEATFAGQVREGGAELGEETGEAEGWFCLEGEQYLMVESRGRQMRIGEVNDGVEVAVERVSEGAQSGGFTGADVAGDESGETFLEGKGKATLDLLVTARGEEIGSRNRFAEGGGAEAVKVIEGGHGSPFGPLVRVARSEWYRVVPG
jgi:hypothetical protein